MTERRRVGWCEAAGTKWSREDGTGRRTWWRGVSPSAVVAPLLIDADPLLVLRHVHLPRQALLQGFPERLRGRRLAVHEVGRTRRALDPPSHRSSSSRSAWADSPSSVSTSARTGISRPNIRSRSAPSCSARPRVPRAWNPTTRTALRWSGSRRARWWRTRPRRIVLRVTVGIGVGGLLFLEVRGVGERDAEEVRGGAGTEHRSTEAAAHDQRQVSHVVDVRVADDDGVQGRGIEGRLRPVALAQALLALEQAAVEQDGLTAVPHQVLGARDRAGGTEELDGGGGWHRWRMAYGVWLMA